jgi:predicted dehydrogenase
MAIGIIGAGGVARYAHLPAYRRLGLNVRAVCDLDPRVAESVGAEFNVPVRTDDPRELVADPAVSVIDIATPPASHLELIDLAARHGKAVLVQKPLCCSPEELRAILKVRERRGRVRLNLSGRHVSAWVKVRELIQGGALGQPMLCTINNRDWWDRAPGRWDHDIEQYIVFEMVIHHLDLCLFWFGPPRRLTARTGTHPRQRMRRANWATVTLEYANGLVVQIVDDWAMPEYSFASGHPFEQVMLTGENGVVRASSERVEWSALGANAVEVWHLPRPGQRLEGEQLETNWFPDSFGRSMRAYLEALERGGGGREDWDHLSELTELTFAVAEAAGSSKWVSFGRHRAEE